MNWTPHQQKQSHRQWRTDETSINHERTVLVSVRSCFDWDPIGVNGIPEATDEYDAYADKAYVMLMDEGATASEIAGYLYIVATEHMGLTDHGHLAERSDQVAQLLVQLRPEFGTH